jgi:hypothetical protein
VITAIAKVNLIKELPAFFCGDTLQQDARGHVTSIELVAN